MNEVFSIQVHNRQFLEQGKQGVWLDLPTTTETLQAALRDVGITADNPQDFFINGYSCPEDRHLAIPYDMVLAADVDELNFLAARLGQLDAAEIAELNAALQNPRGGFENIGQIIDYTENVDYYVHLPDVRGDGQLGDYYLNRSGMVDMPEEWKAGIDTAQFGRHIAQQEQGVFTQYGYLVRSGDEWQRVHEGQPVPEEYRVMHYPQPEADREEPQAQQPEASESPDKAPPPVIPIMLDGMNSKERMKVITDRLETGVQELFESSRYMAYLSAMSKMHDYSLNNTLLIAMQGGSIVAGYNRWQDEFDRHVKRGEKGIKILAPAPFKVKQQMEKIDPATQQPVIGADGKPVTEEQEVTVPAFKVVTVFDISQTEGKDFPMPYISELTGDVQQYQDFFAALERTSPYPISIEPISDGAKGRCFYAKQRIAINEGMSELQTLKTAIHEIAHAKLHAIDREAPAEEQAARPDRSTREVQAESVAYTVCQYYGLDTSDYSFGYVADWSSGRELSELKASLETIRATASELITEIDGHFAQLQQEREARQEQEAVTVDVTPEAAAPAQAEEEQAPALDPAAEPLVTVLWSESPQLDSLLDTYARKLAENMNKGYEITARVPSVLIAGPSNFPVRAKEKQNAASDRNMEEFQYIQGLLDKIRSTGMGGISADDPQAVSKLEKKLEKLEASQELMKAVNAYYRKHGTLDGCPHLTERGIENLKADMASGWHYEKKPFQSWQLSNNNAEIRRLKGRIEELTRQKEAAYVGWEFDGGTVEINRVANRLQIFFEGKPDAAVRDELKSNGFRWSPKAGAWQRQLNDTTIRVADRIKCIQPLSGEKPSALQLAARREKEKPSIRAQLNAAKTEQAKQPPAREKSKGLEVE